MQTNTHTCKTQAQAAATHLYVLVLARYRFYHLLHGGRQVFGVLVNRKIGVSKAQHAAAAGGDVEQRALFGALDLQLQVFLRALGAMNEAGNAGGGGRNRVEVGRGGARTSITIGCFFFWKKTEPMRCGSMRTWQFMRRGTMRDGARASCMRNEQKGGRATRRERAK